MSVEDRLRIGLARNADEFEPAVEQRLDRLIRRRRRRRVATRCLVAAGVAVMISLTLILAPSVVDRFRGSDSVVGQPPPTQALTGSFIASVDLPSAAGPAGAVTGRWRLMFRPDGVIDVTAPPSYTGVVSAVLFESTPDTLRTSLFTQDLCSGLGLGSYRWVRSGDQLKLSVLDDRCQDRVSVLARAWTET